MVSIKGPRPEIPKHAQCNWVIVLGYIFVVLASCFMFSQHAGEWLGSVGPSIHHSKLLGGGSDSSSTNAPTTWRQLQGHETNEEGERFAYVTELHHGVEYLCGAAMLAWNLRMRGEDIDLVAIVSGHLGDTYEEHEVALLYLRKLGFKIHMAPLLTNPFDYYKTEEHVAHNSKKEKKRENYSKINMFALEEYSKIIFVDSDMFLPKGAPDHLFEKYDGGEKPAGRKINGYGINTGFMVVRPNVETYLDMLSKLNEIESATGGDQGFIINYYLTFKHGFEFFHDDHVKQESNKLPPNTGRGPQDRPDPKYNGNYEVYHPFGKKVWHCPRDHYCEENPTAARKYLWPQMEDVWWKKFDAMTGAKPFILEPKFRDYCIKPEESINEKHQSKSWGYIVPKHEMITMREKSKYLKGKN